MLYQKFFAIVIIVFLLVHTAYAQNKVVVVPLAGDNIALAQQNFRYTERIDATGNVISACETDVFKTPDQETQVLLIATANARFTLDSSYWYTNIEFSKNFVPFTGIEGGGSDAFNEARSGSWSQISTTDILDLEPNSSYQFRIDMNASQSDGEFADLGFCELLVSATYKLPRGKSILEVSQ